MQRIAALQFDVSIYILNIVAVKTFLKIPENFIRSR